MSGRILVINPNSNEAVTHGMSEAVEALRLADGPSIDCITLAEGPFGVETQAHVDDVAPLLREMVRAEPADAYVIGCYSDPGLAGCRDAVDAPVLGIRECSVTAALSQGDSFGVVALGRASIARQSLAFRAMGIESRWAGSEPLHLSVEAAEEADAYPKVVEAGRALIARGASVLILGCAGMVRHRLPLARELGVPVVDPTQAAVAHALGLVLLSRG
ncbi:aspartate/glutamate racemase family protein [Rhizobiaceae bacterium]|nr:aspartate/glutamate racemase family protein [Rhizobiaceae bacterium]